jgi:hypothetical protein
MRVSRAESALLASARENHLRVGTHERDRDFGAPSKLAPDDRPYGIPHVLSLPELLIPERVEEAPEGRSPGAEDREGGGEKLRPSSLDVSR